ncbi:protoporphyrinogen oxidase [Sulfidibacter corallicola]|uniref:Coproporphyrinogen III oxidase n=1 Tax=Sulfidibacter corallicola TaxID=2818388 RepID=A0A8A4TPJ7_SULCO|nr:protoporphyrinogen oxidase [Sulfidibacter corallicola]QTD48505.1 protoporphyrinogen oxidase [Sulfidibacter corallicola]
MSAQPIYERNRIEAERGPHRRIVVIGGGISGLSSAWFVQEKARERGMPISLTLLEGSPRLGGVICAERRDGCLLECGPDSIVTQKPAGLDLCHRLGLEDQLYFPETNGGLQILRGGAPYPLPEGLRFGVATKIRPLLASPLFSMPGKVRMLCEPWIGTRKGGEEESVAQLIRRRLGHEVLERVIEPIMAGIFLTDAESLSARRVAPQLVALETRYGSLVRGLTEAGREGPPRPGTGKPPAPMVAALRGGSGTLVRRLSDRLEGRVCCNTPVVELAFDSVAARWRVATAAGHHHEADAVLIAGPAHRAAAWFPREDPLAAQLRGIRYASCTTLNLIYRRDQLANVAPINGFFVPASEGLSFFACTYVHHKFPFRVPADKAVFRVFLRNGLAGAPRLDLGEWVDRVHGDLAPILQARGMPLDACITRFPWAMPRQEVGLTARLAQVQALANQRPGLFLAGGCAGVVGLPDCITSGERAAAGALDFLAAKAEAADRGFAAAGSALAANRTEIEAR